MILAACLCSILPAQETGQGEAEQLERFLSRLGLVDLQIMHLEQSLEKVDPSAQKVELARRLADLYAARLITAADDSARYEEIIERVRKLVADVPEANTTSLQVMLLQADYTRAETLMARWLEDAGQTQALADATEILARIAPQLDTFQNELNARVDELQDQFLELEEADPQRQELEQELRRRVEAAGQATYFSGWSSYYLGLAKLETGGDDLLRARAAFRKLLSLGEEDAYAEIEPEWLRLESSSMAWTLIGLGLTEIALGNLDDGRACFRLLDHRSAPPLVRDQRPAYLLQGMLNARRYEEAAEYAEEQLALFGGSATQGKVAFCATLVRAGYAGDAAQSDEQRRRLGELGIDGLARLRQIGAIRQLAEKYGIDLSDARGFYRLWVKGQQVFSAAEETKDAEGYRQAEELLSAALAEPEARRDLLSAGECRNLLGWCRYRLEKFEAAAEEFRAAMGLLAGGGDTAVKAAWMAFLSYYKGSEAEKGLLRDAIEMLEEIKDRFPGTKEAEQADFQLLKLRKSAGSVEETIRELEQVQPKAANYLSARYDICRLRFEEWAKDKSDAAKADKTKQAVEVYLRAARDDERHGHKTKAALWAADVAMGKTPSDDEAAGRYLAAAERYAAELPGGAAERSQLAFVRLQLAQKQGDAAAAREQARWLAEHAAGSRYELSAVILLATDADRALASASGEQRRPRLQEAAELYGRLVELVGSSPKQLAAEKNARVASSKLADYEFELGRYEQAAELLESLVAAYPDERGYLRRAGLAQYKAGNYEASLEHWRKLAVGLPKNSDAWYFARYYQFACLRRTDISAAGEAYRQFKRLHPSVNVDVWKNDPEGLRAALGG